MTSATEFIDEPDTIRNEAVDNGLLVTDNRTTDNEQDNKIKNLVATIMQVDVQANGSVLDDQREAYVRGIKAALMMLGGLL